MGFEVFINFGTTTPTRLYAMSCFIAQHGPLPRIRVIEVIQPSAITDNPSMASDVFRSLELLRLIDTSSDKERLAQLAIDRNILSSLDTFRLFLQETITGITEDVGDNYLLNQFAAWYGVQDERVLNMTRSDYETNFHQQLYPGENKRLVTQSQSIPLWTAWAEFLGWGWQLREGVFIPDCTLRLRPLLADLLPETDFIPFNTFMERLSVHCPELDGGVLFERCWQASRPYEQRGNRLSLMLSTALRVLNQRGELVLENRADASENWTLFPAQSYISRVTHIRKGTTV